MIDPLPSQVRNWTLCCHLSALAGYVFPFGNIIGPLLVWLFKKEEIPEVEEHGRAALNFQISMTLYSILAALTIFVVIGVILLPAVLLLNLVFVIIASIKASEGQLYRYPLSIRFLA